MPTQSAGETRSREMARYFLLALPLLATLLLVPRLIQWLQIGTTFIAWPWQFDLAEGVNLSATVQLAGGHNIYAPNGPQSFVSAPYTPLFFLLNAPFTWLTGPSFAVGRTISMLSTLAIAALLFYLVRRISSAWGAGILAGALWLSLSPVITWSALYTQHTLALALGLAGLAWTVRSSQRAHNGTSQAHTGQLYFGAALFALAFFTKQSAIDAASATTLWLLATDWRKGVRFALALAALIVLPFAALTLVSQGGFWEKVVANHPVAWSDTRAVRLVTRVWSEYWPLILWAISYLLAMLAYIALPLIRRANSPSLKQVMSSGWTLATIYAVVSAASVLARIGNDGINYNHFLDVLIPCCLLVGLSVGKAMRWASSPFRLAGPAALTLCALLLAAQILQYQDPHTWYNGMWPDAARDAQMRSLSKLVADTPGDILSDDSYLLLSNGRRVLYDDSFMFATLAETGKWDNSVLVQSLRDRRFSLLFLFDTDRWPDDQQIALQDNYSLKFLDVLRTFVPDIVPRSPQYSMNCTLSQGKDSVALKGYSLAPAVAENGIKHGQVLRATLYWQADNNIAEDYASYIHLVGDDGSKVAAQDNPHTGALVPTTGWPAGSVITDTLSIPIAETTQPARYRLVAGMYSLDSASGQIVALPARCQAGEQYGDAVSLGWVEVK